jgi:hypothetical protein
VLLGRGTLPSVGAGAALIAAPIVGDDGELVGEDLGYPLKVASIPRCARYEEHRRTASAHLVVDPCAIDLKEPTGWLRFI